MNNENNRVSCIAHNSVWNTNLPCLSAVGALYIWPCFSSISVFYMRCAILNYETVFRVKGVDACEGCLLAVILLLGRHGAIGYRLDLHVVFLVQLAHNYWRLVPAMGG